MSLQCLALCRVNDSQNWFKILQDASWSLGLEDAIKYRLLRQIHSMSANPQGTEHVAEEEELMDRKWCKKNAEGGGTNKSSRWSGTRKQGELVLDLKNAWAQRKRDKDLGGQAAAQGHIQAQGWVCVGDRGWSHLSGSHTQRLWQEEHRGKDWYFTEGFDL